MPKSGNQKKTKPMKKQRGVITPIIISLGLAFLGLALAIYALNNLNLRIGKVSGTPEETVEEFYTWYLDFEVNPRNEKDYMGSELLSAGCKEKIGQARGFDPFLCAQDIPPEFNVGNTEIDGNKATVELEQIFPTGKRIIPIELEKREEQWVITDVVCPQTKAQQGTGEEEQIIVVYYPNEEKRPEGVTDCSLVYGTERTITSTENIFEKKLNELFKGPTEEEQDEGFSSFFSEETEDILSEVVVEESTVYVDLVDIRDIIPSANSSCGSQEFIASVEETIMHNNQNYEWMQIGCTEENNNCAPGPLE